ncbi:hemolysin family protein [Cerasicoccus fimbriatus]|uniref:hemolysin family protein n=1 Tax=Cerasicoccus fimbriatus TaxID=3014554 RepID=UPI0022B57644|nr:hemolysin family protein [Cerasicoccus sp. TK19100]
MKTTLTEFLILGGALVCLLLVNALLVACEISLIKLRYADPDEFDLGKLRSRKRVSYLLNQTDWAAPVMRFGIMAVTIALGLVLFPMLGFAMQEVAFFHEQPGATIKALIAFLVAASVVSICGFLIPRAFALSDPIRALRLSSWFIIGIVAIVLPWFKLLRTVAKRIVTLMGLKFEHDFNVLDFEVQIRALAEDDEPPSPYQRKLLRNSLRLRDLEVSDVILPRNQVQLFDLENSVEENLALAREAGHTRFPLCDGDLDRCVGLIHIKDLFRYPGDLKAVNLRKIARKIERFNANTKLEEALQRMLAQKIHMALVSDEFGGALGVVTLETILEELVGEIDDEFDIPESEDFTQTGPDEYLVDGLMAIHDLEEELDVQIETDDVSTVGGLITNELGRIPEADETLTLNEYGLEITVKEVDERRVLSAAVKKIPVVADED